MFNPIGTSVHYGDSSLIMRLKTHSPSHFHRGIIAGIHVAMKMSLLVDDLTKEEKDALLVLNEMLAQMLPSEAHLEHSFKMPEQQAPTLS